MAVSNSTHMQYQQLGQNGPIVSRLALGTMTFGAETNEAEAFRQLDCFADYGGTFIDTADVYSAGISEEIIGRWIKQRGGLGQMILATKGRFAPPAGSYGGSRRAIVKSVEASLKRLQLDSIDVYYMHGWDTQTDIEETVNALGDLIRMGKIHHIAWSNVSGWQIQKIVSTCDKLGVSRPISVQPQYNLLDRGIEVEVLPCCLENGIGLAPWSPLGGGWLTGKYNRQTVPTGSTRLGENPARGVEAYDKRNTDKTYRVLDTLESIATQHQVPISHVALTWLLSRPAVNTLLLGARTIGQLEDNLKSISLELERKEINTLTKVSAPGLPEYPYQFLTDWSGITIWDELGSSL
ncbi:aldo/keto reductase [Marinomonas sp. S3726]|uniref:aldo/keto reductase n=1 Tax=Marinomonas sp. S3726 TaxID=579484 RepID=UPI000A3ED3A2|nr:aldo/keto reductase [Marinomonas sp. S3726]